MILNSFAHFGSQARLWLGYHLLRATPWGMMRIVRQLNAHRMHSPQTERDEIKRFHDLMRAVDARRLSCRACESCATTTSVEQLPSIAAPVLYLAADRDTLVPSVEQARLMSELTPSATMRILRAWTQLPDRAGHGSGRDPRRMTVLMDVKSLAWRTMSLAPSRCRGWWPKPGAAIKIEPPWGDPLDGLCKRWYDDLHRGMRRGTNRSENRRRPRSDDGAARDSRMCFWRASDLSALARLAPGCDVVAIAFPSLRHVNIVGDTVNPEEPGHDLTYQARAGFPACGGEVGHAADVVRGHGRRRTRARGNQGRDAASRAEPRSRSLRRAERSGDAAASTV